MSASTTRVQLPYEFKNSKLLLRALTHKSFENECLENKSGHNEVLEFLGDSVLGLALSDLLIREFPEDQEGQLSKKRASLVNESFLASLALELKLEAELRLGRGERLTGGDKKPRILSSTLEAVLGAVFLDSGFVEASRVIETLFLPKIRSQDWKVEYKTDYKTRLQEYIQDKHGKTPSYHLMSEVGPDHEKKFEVEVRMEDQPLGVGLGGSKKQAEQNAAQHALSKLEGSQEYESV